jgi:hypothetical protein
MQQKGFRVLPMDWVVFPLCTTLEIWVLSLERYFAVWMASADVLLFLVFVSTSTANSLLIL